MNPLDPINPIAVVANIRRLADHDVMRLTQHAHQEMVADNVTLTELRESLLDCEILENYPDHRRGPCCLVHGMTSQKRDLHVVCTTVQPLLIIITVYVPKPPKWLTPTQRNPSR